MLSQIAYYHWREFQSLLTAVIIVYMKPLKPIKSYCYSTIIREPSTSKKSIAISNNLVNNKSVKPPSTATPRDVVRYCNRVLSIIFNEVFKHGVNIINDSVAIPKYRLSGKLSLAPLTLSRYERGAYHFSAETTGAFAQLLASCRFERSLNIEIRNQTAQSISSHIPIPFVTVSASPNPSTSPHAKAVAAYLHNLLQFLP